MTRCQFCGTPDAYDTGYHVECVNERCKYFSKKWAFTVKKDDSSVWTPPPVESHQKAGLLPYRAPAHQLPAVPPNTLGDPLSNAYDAGETIETEREYAAERGVLRPVGPTIELPRGHSRGFRAIRGEPGRFCELDSGREFDASEFRAGEYFDQIHVGYMEHPHSSIALGSEYVFFRHLSGKGPGYSSNRPALYSNMCLANRIPYGERAILKSATIRLIDGPSGEPCSPDDPRVTWLGEHGWIRFEINRLLSVEGQLYKFLQGYPLIDEPFIYTDHDLTASLKIGRGRESFPSTVVSFILDAVIIRATTKG